MDASEENNDGWSSGEDPMNSSDAEEEGGETVDKKLVSAINYLRKVIKHY